MTHGLDTSVVVASELAGHARHEASRKLNPADFQVFGCFTVLEP